MSYFSLVFTFEKDHTSAKGVLIFLRPYIQSLLGMSDWRNWLERTSPVREVVSSNPGRDTCLVWNSGKFCNPSFLGGRIDKDPLEGTPCSTQSLVLIYYCDCVVRIELA